MKKHLLLTVFGLFLLSQLASVYAQNDKDELREVATGKIVKGQVDKDKTEILEITGLGETTFSASNTFDGSEKSYNHSIIITQAIAVNSKTLKLNLVFHSEQAKTLFAAMVAGDEIKIYYPLSLYEVIKQKLDMAIAAKKKVQVKVTQKVDGFREGVLIF